jgi:hypothetical protein
MWRHVQSEALASLRGNLVAEREELARLTGQMELALDYAGQDR